MLRLTYGSLDSPESIPQTASRSVQPLLQGSRLWQTDRQTDRPRYSVCNNRPHLPSSEMRPDNKMCNIVATDDTNQWHNIKEIYNIHLYQSMNIPNAVVFTRTANTRCGDAIDETLKISHENVAAVSRHSTYLLRAELNRRPAVAQTAAMKSLFIDELDNETCQLGPRGHPCCSIFKHGDHSLQPLLYACRQYLPML